MKAEQTHNQFPSWQIERAGILHRACLSVESALSQGRQMRRTLNRVAKRYNGKSFKADSGKRLALSPTTFRYHFKRWRTGGRSPVVFKLNYHPTNPGIPAPVLIRFINFIADRDFSSMRAASDAFSKGRSVAIGQSALAWNLPKGCFVRLKRARVAKAKAEREIQNLRYGFIFEIQSRPPIQPPEKATDFQI